MAGEYKPQFETGGENSSEIKTCMWCGKKGRDLVLVDDVCPECAKKLAAARKKAPHSAEADSTETQRSDALDVILPETGSGKLIQTQAVVLMVLGVAVSLILGIWICTLGEQLMLPGVLIIVVGAVFSWIGMTILRGFGEMVESSKRIENFIKKSRK